MARIVNITFNIQTTASVTAVKALNEQFKQTARYGKQVEKPINIQVNTSGATAGLNGLNSGLADIVPRADNAGKAMAGLGTMMVASFVSAKGIAIFKSFSEDFLKLENAIYALKVVAGSTAPSIEQLRMGMLDLAKTSSFTAVEFANAMDTIMRTGQSFRDAQNLTKASENLALASGESLGDAVNILNKLVVALSINTGDAEQVTQSLHATAIATATSLEGLGSSARQWVGAMGVLSSTTDKSGVDLRKYRIALMEVGNTFTGILANMGKILPFHTNPCKRGVIKLVA